MPRIIISIDGVMLKEVLLSKERTTLGRRPCNDVVIDNPAVSGEHAALHWNGHAASLEDLRSTNGTYINAQRVRQQMLQHNDVVEIGKYKIRYLTSPSFSLPDGALDAASGPESWPDTGWNHTGLMPLSLPGAARAPAASATQAVIKVLSGIDAGRDIELQHVVTTIGRPGVAVAAVTRRLCGYMVTPVDGATLVNTLSIGPEAVALHHGDMLELAAVQMRFELV